MNCKGFLSALFLFLGFFSVSGQENELTIRQITSAAGLPQNSVKAIAIDSSGFVWLTTEGGLVRYDGRNILTYNQSNMPELKGDRFQDIFYDYNSNLLITNNYGTLLHIRGNKPELVPGNKKNIPGYLIFQGGFPNYKEYYNLSNYGRNNKNNIWKNNPILILPYGPNQFATPILNTIYFFNGTQQISSLNADINPDHTFMIDTCIFFQNKKGELLKLDANTKIAKNVTLTFTGTQTFHTPEFNKIIWSYKNQFAYYKDGNSLIRIGLSMTGDTITCEKVSDGVPENCKITSIVYQPATGFYFIGTDTKGLFIYKPKFLHNLPVSEKIYTLNNSFYGQAPIDSNHVFTTFGLVIGMDTTYQREPRKFNYESLLITKNNDLYYSWGDTLYRMEKSGKKDKFKFLTGLVSCYLEEKDKIYFGSTHGIGIIEKDTIKFVKPGSGLNFNTRPIQLIKDKQSHFWVATCDGLTRYNSNFSNSTVIPELKDVCLRSLFQWGEYIFAGSYGNGYYLIKGMRVIKMPLDQKNRLAQVHSFFVDKKGTIWFSTNNGLFIASLKEILSYFENPGQKIYYYLINQDDGIKNPEFNGGCSPSVVYLRNGYLSYPSFDGLVWIQPDLMKPLFPSNKIFFENIKADQEDSLNLQDIHLEPDFKNLLVDIVVPFWGKPENLTLEYRLDNPDSTWEKIEPEEKRLRFGNLPSGKHKLEVRVRYGFGKDDYYYNQLTFKVDEYFYEKSWIQLIGIAIFLGLVILAVREYSKNIIRKNQQLEKNINERTAELKESNELLHDNLLKLQQSEEELSTALTLRDKLMSIISHDLVTPIRYITISSRLARNEAATSPRDEIVQILAEIEATTMRIHDNAQNVLHWIRFQSKGMTSTKSNVAIHDLVDEIVTLYQPIAGAGNSVIENNTPEEDIIISDPRILKIVIQNILNNAVKFTKSGAIVIDSETFAKDYRIRISDTGPGFSEAALESIRQLRMNLQLHPFTSDFSEDGTHLGYQIIYELLRFLEGDFTIKSSPEGSIVEITLHNCLQESL